MAVADDAVEAPLLRHGDEMLVGGVEEHQSAVGLEEVVELALGALHALERSEALQMGAADVGDEAAGGLNVFHELLDVARVGGAHLDDGNLVVGIEAEQCLGHTDVVVEVALGVHHVVFLSQDGRNEFLGSGLAVGAGDADDGDVELAAVLARELLEGQEAVIDEDETWVGGVGIFRFIDDGVAASLVERALGKLVAVERSTLEGNENTAARTVAAVGGHLRMLQVKLIELGDIHNRMFLPGQR